MNTTMRGISIGIASLMLGTAGFVRAQVQTVWTNSGGGTFSTPANWDNGVPLTGTNAWFGLSGQSYGVDFTGAAATRTVLVTGQNQTVTFNLGGFTYSVGSGAPAIASLPHVFVGSNASDSVNLVVTNGTINLIASANYQQFEINGGSALVISNGGRVIANDIDFTSTGTVLVNTGGYLSIGQDLTGSGTALLVVTNGGIAAIRPFNGAYNATVLVSGPGSVLTNIQDNSTFNGATGTLEVNNGGLLYQNGTFLRLGWNGAGGTFIVGGSGTATAMVSTAALALGRDHVSYPTPQHLLLYTNGLIRIRGNTQPLSVVKADALVEPGSVATLLGGQVQLTNNSVFAVATNAVLRGAGSFNRLVPGEKFLLVNDKGRIRPGDHGPTLTSNVAALGTIALVGGDLIQTNPFGPAGMNFEFGLAAGDQINIQDGSALITAGSNVFSLASGAPAPLPGVKYGLGNYDFIIASNVTYSPGYDNLVSLLTNTYGLTEGVDFQYGIVFLDGGLSALRLSFVPEPSTLLLLALGGALVARRRRRTP